MVNFDEFLKTWSLRANSVTRQVTFNRSKIGGKCQNSNAVIYGLFIGHSCNEQKYSWFVWGEKDHMWDERKLWPFFLPFLLAKTKSFLSRHEQKKTCFSPARSPIYWASSAYIIHVCHFAFYLFFVWWCSFKKSQTQCLKITVKGLIQHCKRSELCLHLECIVHFGEFLKILSLRSNSVTRQVTFNRTKIGGKRLN